MVDELKAHHTSSRELVGDAAAMTAAEVEESRVLRKEVISLQPALPLAPEPVPMPMPSHRPGQSVQPCLENILPSAPQLTANHQPRRLLADPTHTAAPINVQIPRTQPQPRPSGFTPKGMCNKCGVPPTVATGHSRQCKHSTCPNTHCSECRAPLEGHPGPPGRGCRNASARCPPLICCSMPPCPP